jgi:hypothetical protein
VFVANRRYPDGPNPWWDEALVNPHLELLDNVRMIHPERAAKAPFAQDLVFHAAVQTAPAGSR